MAPRKLMLLIAAVGSLASVACSGADHVAYSGGGSTLESTDYAPVATTCERGAVQACTIWLGKTGDLSNCAQGVQVCTDEGWSDCIDQETVADDPELYAELMGEVEDAE